METKNCGQRSECSVSSVKAITLHLVAEWLGRSASLAWPFVLMERGILNLTYKTYLHVAYICNHIYPL